MVSISTSKFRQYAGFGIVSILSSILFTVLSSNASEIKTVAGDKIERQFGSQVEIDTGSIGISWTASGDDGYSGFADHYVIKYSTEVISESNWDLASSVGNPPSPQEAGTPQSLTINDLVRGGRYYIAIKAYDEAYNASEISNVAGKYASGIIIPSIAGAEIDSLGHSAIVMAHSVDSEHPLFYEFALDTLSTFATPTLGIDFLADTLARSSFGNLADNLIYYWRARAVANDRSDSSNWSAPDSFRIAPANSNPQVRVEFPNGGEIWQPGSIQNIVWSDSDNVGIVGNRLEYSIDGGLTWLMIRDWTPGDPRQFSLVVPNISSSRCRVKVLCRDNDNNIAFDISDSDFTVGNGDSIPAVTLITPNGRERWDAFSTHLIAWADSDDQGVTAFMLEYSTNNGDTWNLIQDWTDGDPHEYNWTLPDTPSRQARVRVSCRDAFNNMTSDISDRNFTIRDVVGPRVNLVFPNGGDTLEIHTDTSIVWQASDNIGIDSFMVELSANNGDRWDTLVPWQSGNPQAIPWNVPIILTGQCLMRVSCKDFDDNVSCDTSNSWFLIEDSAAPTVSITSPGHEPLLRYDSIFVSWIAQDNGTIVLGLAEYSTDDGYSWNSLWQDTIGGAGAFWWTGPDIPQSFDLRVACTDAAGNTGGDTVSLDITDLLAESSSAPQRYFLAPSYPNPFNPSTTISYGLPEASHVSIEIYDALGRKITTLFDGEQEASLYSITWNAAEMSSGTYFYIIRAGAYTASQKMMLVK